MKSRKPLQRSVASLAILLCLLALPLKAAEPGWMPVIIAKEPLKSQIKATPIEYRQNRPLHFYGNTVRRIHYRGNPLPTRHDIEMTIRCLKVIAKRSR